MARASGSRKVAQAASMGGVGQRRRLIGFPAAVALIIIAGIAVVAVARIQRDAEARPGLDDHWHSAYGVWDCRTEEFQPVFEGRVNAQGFPFDPEGIHSHSDGIIHIHPFTANASGEDATLGKFFNAMFVTMDENAITAAEFGVISAVNAECDGQPAVIQVLRWSSALTGIASEPDERIFSDFEDVHFQRNGEAFTLALAPANAVVPLPPTIGDLLGVSSLLALEGVPEGPVTLDDELDDGGTGPRVEDDG